MTVFVFVLVTTFARVFCVVIMVVIITQEAYAIPPTPFFFDSQRLGGTYPRKALFS